MLRKIEFYNCPDGTINIQADGQPVRQFTEECKDVVQEMLLLIRDLYPGAFAALSELYSESCRNKPYFEFRIVHRFVRCNFGEYDGLQFDIDGAGRFNFEHVDCPLRGECSYEGVICRPALKSELTARETEVVKLLLQGYDKVAIADELGISPFTLIRHLANIRCRLGLSSSSQILTHFKNGL